MLDHLVITVSDLELSKAFYTAALVPLGYQLTEDRQRAAAFGVLSGAGKSSDPGGDFWISVGAAMTPRVHFAFSAPSRGAVDAFHEAALRAGGVDNGRPGLRPEYHPNYYAAFILDPDGYNIEAVCHLEL